jgi:hypothetical protein
VVQEHTAKDMMAVVVQYLLMHRKGARAEVEQAAPAHKQFRTALEQAD